MQFVKNLGRPSRSTVVPMYNMPLLLFRENKNLYSWGEGDLNAEKYGLLRASVVLNRPTALHSLKSVRR